MQYWAADAASEESSVKAVLHQAKLVRPKSEVQMCAFLHRWVMICHATGLGNALVAGEFVCQVVYDAMSVTGLPWYVAHELFLV